MSQVFLKFFMVKKIVSIYFWLHWVFIDMHGFLLEVTALVEHGLWAFGFNSYGILP